MSYRILTLLSLLIQCQTISMIMTLDELEVDKKCISFGTFNELSSIEKSFEIFMLQAFNLSHSTSAKLQKFTQKCFQFYFKL